MPNKLIGTGANQVPLNGMLGELAFQTKENINFTGGTGKLSKLDIDSISSQLGVTAVDVFVYDTSKDSDGGAWRKRCQNTSWYNETLNTEKRGSRREFPSVAVIVALTNSVIIYDGDDPTLPMWRVFSTFGVMYEGTIKAVTALNAKIITGCTYDVYWADLIRDRYFEFENAVYYRLTSIAEEVDNGRVTITTSALVNRTVNDIAATVVPGTPIDQDTGLPNITIGVATEGGVSVLKYDYSTVYFTNNNASYQRSVYVMFNNKGQIQFVMDASSRYLRTFNIPTYNKVVDQWASSLDDGITVGLDIDTFTGSATPIWSITTNTIGTALGFEMFEEYSPDPLSSLYTNITNTYNTGWMQGRNKGTWLSDTTQETLVGGELITNGAFASNASGWSAYGSSGRYTWEGGALKVERLDGTYTSGFPVQTINTIPGKTYTVSFQLGTNNGQAILNVWSANYSTLLADFRKTTPGYYCTSFVATTTTSTLLFGNDFNSTYFYLDNVSVKLSDPDRSSYNAGLQVNGNISKTPVAAGANLVAYSGFTSSNYLFQPYHLNSPAALIGAGDYTIMCWVKMSGFGYQHFIGIHDPSANQGDPGTVNLKIGPDGVPYVYCNSGVGGAAATINSGYSLSTNHWHHLALVRNGNMHILYVDGIKRNQQLQSSYTVATQGVMIGTGNGVAEAAYNASIALAKISNTAPTKEQIAKIFNDEKQLFKNDAQATLYGASNGITALAYDEDTKLLHVGTSSGRSVFQGLRRVDNTTTAVSASISAANGLVAEQ